MPTIITANKAREKGSYFPELSFADRNGDAVTPNTMTWTLSKEDGTVVNEREDIEETPAASIVVVLFGDDLATFAGDNFQRVLTSKITYDTIINGVTYTDLPENDELHFSIEGLVNVS
jgi:hypothetical protein